MTMKAKHWLYGGAAGMMTLFLAGCGATPTANIPVPPAVKGDRTIQLLPNHRLPLSVAPVNGKRAVTILQEMTGPVNSTPPAVFDHHKAAIRQAYKSLPQGTMRGLKFTDGTGFLIAKIPVETSLSQLASLTSQPVPQLGGLPSGYQMTQATAIGTGVGDLNELYQLPAFAALTPPTYQAYTLPSFSPPVGNYIHLQLQTTTGLEKMKVVGAFRSVHSIHTAHGQAVFLQYQPWWSLYPGMTQVEVGVQKKGHAYLMTLTSRGFTLKQLIGMVQSLSWTT